MPRCQVQLKSTDFRSLASLAGRYGGGGSWNPPRPWPPPGACAPAGAAPGGACALAVENMLSESRAVAAMVVHFMRRKDMVISRLVVGVAGRDLDYASIRHGHGL